ncbi:MAG: LamG domain-containing protein [Myxococcota bacterium]
MMTRRLIFIVLCGLVAAACSAAETPGIGGTEDVAVAGDDATTPTPDGSECVATDDCDDGNPCTEGICTVDGTCRQIAQVGDPCDDGSACTEGETCQSDGQCGGGADITGNDDPCQVCTCDPKEGVTCAPRNEGDACSDADCCTLADACLACDPESDPGCADYGLKCVGSPKSCDDDNSCTLDVCSCDGDTVTCSNDDAPDGFPCDYSTNDCTTGDSCIAGQCILSPPLDLDDQNPCTEDKCDKGEVIHTFLLTGQCDDDDECTMDDHCELGACVGGDLVQCVQGPCESSASCVPGEGCVGVALPNGAACNDDNPCTSGETCDVDQQCVPSETVSCDDGNPCTADLCDPNDGSCTNDPSEVLEGTPCVPAEASCSNEGACVAGICVPDAGLDCDDGNPCTLDTCDEATGCLNEPTEGSCDDGNPCTLDDSCLGGLCEPGPWAETEACNPPPACVDGDTIANCGQVNDLDSDGCCCFAEDPTGAHKSGHVVDLGQVEVGLQVECCIQPGFSSGCEDVAFIDGSIDGNAWTALASFPTTSSKNDQGAWVTQCVTVSSDEELRYIRGANDQCYVDFFECTVLCEDEGFDCDNANCDDGNPCTTDACDPESGCVANPDPTMDGSPCPPPSACATSGVCHDGLCVPSEPSVNCDDGDPCTTDSCDDEEGCQHVTLPDCGVALCGSKAAELDGESCIEVPNFLDEGVPSYTIEFWFQPFDNDSEACLLDKVTGEGMSDAPGWMIRYNDMPPVWESSIHYQEASLDGNFHGLLTGNAYLPGEWHHYALVRGETGLMRRFVDGVGGSLNQFNSEQFVPIQLSPEPMWLGCRDNALHFLNGRIDELRISAGERYTSSFAPPTEPFVSDEATLLLYHFEGPSDGIVVDSSGLGHDGTWLGKDQRPKVSPVQACDDGDPCTTDTCDPDTNGCLYTPIEGCGDVSACTTYRFAWTDGFDVPQSGTFDVLNGAIIALNFEYELKFPDACDDLASPWCHFPGSDWTIESSDFTALEPNGFHMLAFSEHDTEFRFYHEAWLNNPAIYMLKPVGGQNTTAYDPDVSWTAIGDCEGTPCDALDCDDGDPCTADTCGPSGCVHTEDSSADGCEPIATCGDEIKVNCGGACCCFATSHTLDLGVEISPAADVDCCIRPGLNCGCTGDAEFEVSADGIAWETVALFETVSDKVGGVCPNNAVAWVDHCAPVSAAEPYRYVRGTHNDCYADFFQCVVAAKTCDDNDPCTLDQCDEETGSCTYEAVTDDPTCLTLNAGNNLSSFYALPEGDASIAAVFGDKASAVNWFFAEGVGAYRLSTGELVGNYRTLEPWRGYWIHMDEEVTLHLSGTPRPPDLRYWLHPGTNMISYAGGEPSEVVDGLSESAQDSIEAVIGSGVAVFKDDTDNWVGSATLESWRGYEVVSADPIEPFSWDLAAPEPSTLTYGCTDPHASNVDPTADVDNGSCTYDVPGDWARPVWGYDMPMYQLIVIIQAPTIDGEPMAQGDAIGAFHEGTSVGFGFAQGEFVTLAAMNVPHEGVVTLSVYDASAQSEAMMDVAVTAPPEAEGYKNRFIFIGCMDESAVNYLPEATLDSGICVY